jgi:hypothetical protein
MVRVDYKTYLIYTKNVYREWMTCVDLSYWGLANNDLNEAVAYLTNDHPTSSYDTLDDIDVEMKELPRATQPIYGPAPPPSYEEVVPEAEVIIYIQ